MNGNPNFFNGTRELRCPSCGALIARNLLVPENPGLVLEFECPVKECRGRVLWPMIELPPHVEQQPCARF